MSRSSWKVRPATGLAIVFSLVLVACSEPETIVLDTSQLNLNPTQAELEAIFGIDSTSDLPATVTDDDSEQIPVPVTYNPGPQSIFEFSEDALSESSVPKDSLNGLFYTRSNNTSLLTGPVFGTGEIQNSEIRRIIPYTLMRQAESLELIAVYLLRGNNTSVIDTDLAVGVVKNNSTRTQCHIRASGITLLDMQGNPSEDFIAESAFVRGASGTDSPWRDIPDVSTCLGVGDYGYFKASLDTNLEVVGGIAIEQLDFLDRDYVIPTPIMIPVTYDVTEAGLTVQVVNQSTVFLEMSGIDSVFLDEQGLPLGLDRWNPWPDVILAPGQEYVFDVDVEFRGSVSSIRFLLDLKDD